MLFIHTIDKVLSGEKTQTRRIAKPGDEWFPEDLGDAAAVMHKGFSAYRLVYEVGKTYAVQPGRGKPAVARIRITGIRSEDVREIDYEDVRAEGFKYESEFLYTWCMMHDKKGYSEYFEQNVKTVVHQPAAFLKSRPAERYQAWVLTFALVKPDTGA